MRIKRDQDWMLDLYKQRKTSIEDFAGFIIDETPDPTTRNEDEEGIEEEKHDGVEEDTTSGF
jgi:hypothetical protein